MDDARAIVKEMVDVLEHPGMVSYTTPEGKCWCVVPHDDHSRLCKRTTAILARAKEWMVVGGVGCWEPHTGTPWMCEGTLWLCALLVGMASCALAVVL